MISRALLPCCGTMATTPHLEVRQLGAVHVTRHRNLPRHKAEVPAQGRGGEGEGRGGGAGGTVWRKVLTGPRGVGPHGLCRRGPARRHKRGQGEGSMQDAGEGGRLAANAATVRDPTIMPLIPTRCGSLGRRPATRTHTMLLQHVRRLPRTCRSRGGSQRRFRSRPGRWPTPATAAPHVQRHPGIGSSAKGTHRHHGRQALACKRSFATSRSRQGGWRRVGSIPA